MTKKILIAYYSWSNKTKQVAKKLAQALDAELLELTVKNNVFSTDMYKTSEIAKTQIKTNDFPELVTKIPDISQYETILVGSPVWNGAPATPLHSFLAQIANFKGKIATFYTDAGSVGAYGESFKTWAAPLTVVSIYQQQKDILTWAKEVIEK